MKKVLLVGNSAKEIPYITELEFRCNWCGTSFISSFLENDYWYEDYYYKHAISICPNCNKRCRTKNILRKINIRKM